MIAFSVLALAATSAFQPDAASMEPAPPTNPSISLGTLMTQYYPERAMRMNISGRVVAKCVVSETGQLSICQIAEEMPTGYGFGAATLRVLRLVHARPATRDGKAIEAEMTIPILWQLGGSAPSTPQAPPVPQ